MVARRRLVVRDKKAEIVEAVSGAVVVEIERGGEVNALAWSPDGSRLVVGGRDNKAIVLSGPASTPAPVTEIALDTATIPAELLSLMLTTVPADGGMALIGRSLRRIGASDV